MTEKTKTKRTQIKDLAVNEQELTGQEMEKVQGGVVNSAGAGGIKSEPTNPGNPFPAATTTTTVAKAKAWMVNN